MASKLGLAVRSAGEQYEDGRRGETIQGLTDQLERCRINPVGILQVTFLSEAGSGR